MRRSLAGVAVASLAAATLAATASAALYLTFSRATASPGDRVVARTGGRGAIRLPAGRAPLRVYLVERSVAGSVRSQMDPRIVPLGRLALHRVKPHFANGRLEFAVPNVPPGDYNYTTLIHCIPCAPHSNGRTLGAWRSMARSVSGHRSDAPPYVTARAPSTDSCLLGGKARRFSQDRLAFSISTTAFAALATRRFGARRAATRASRSCCLFEVARRRR